MSTPILPFAVWASGTNQNSVPANDNSLRSQILNGLVIDDATAAQPGAPTAGDIYIIPAAATGAQWATFDEDDLVIFDAGNWYAFAPVEGVVVNFDGAQKQWTSVSGWQAFSAGGAMTNPMTTAADIIVGGVAGAPARLAKGTGLQVLRMNAAAAAQEWAAVTQCIPISCTDDATAITAGAAKFTFHMPFAFSLSEVIAGLTTPQASGSIFTVDLNETGASILSTKLTIDNTEETSLTAATPAVISDAALAKGAKITIDVDQIGNGTAKGLKVYLIGALA